MRKKTEFNDLLDNFGSPGNISEDIVAFALHLKGLRRQQIEKPFHAFAMNSNEIDQLDEIIRTIIQCNTNDVRFQIAFSKLNPVLNHWSFLEFAFKADEDKPKLDILICDPLGIQKSFVLAMALSNIIKFGELSHFCELTVYLPVETLQERGRGCAYFALDNISMLSNQDEYQDLYTYMQAHRCMNSEQRIQSELENTMENMKDVYEDDPVESKRIFNFRVVAGSLPVRLLRTMQSQKNLEKLADSQNGNDIVNKKQETLSKSLGKYCFVVEARDHSQHKRNQRVNEKMEKMRKDAEISLSGTLSDSSVNQTTLSFQQGAQARRLDGLAEWVNEVLDLAASEDEIGYNC
ncbi:hypothetical protein [Legionella spiritensis]|uniref:Uncharacterized protein n=1 Tax=Legionella spiritensis TaxID=452 RepID=A0A0W0Z7X1_LEGSP|nr:hypothetical protein [Legionella spiritensis]KTD65225.1 hypothetical protein Lspi_0777 [Legionella spiritensis]SNV39587.1 Uncharacterised protein [Legionella spiritensis]